MVPRPPRLGRMWHSTLFRSLVLASTALAACAAPRSEGGADPGALRPNLVFVLADDLGWTDLACQGSGYYATPHIDALAARGTRFTQAYAAAPNCAPTRASLMTGLAAPRTGVYTVGSSKRGRAERRRLEPVENRTDLDARFVTLAEVLVEAGWRTAAFGKWHLGQGELTGPTAQGFEHSVGGDPRGHPPSYLSPYAKGGGAPPPGLEGAPEGEYLTDRLTDEASDWIRAHADEPFFCYLSHFAVHTPIQAPTASVEQFRDRAVWGGHDDPRYAAMISHLDRSVGRIGALLEELGIADRTLVVFTSDNGGLGGYAEAGVEGIADLTSNAPLRGGKGMIEEGGIRVPLIAAWPGRVPSGRVCPVPTSTVDHFPTLLGLLGLEAPENDGADLGPVWLGEQRPQSEHDLVWHLPVYLEASGKLGTWRLTPSAAIRRGDWKLIERFETGAVELYHLARDPGERNDLAASEPERVEQLRAALADWRVRTGAELPRPLD
jgi:arylsulfatase A-like enzyme